MAKPAINLPLVSKFYDGGIKDAESALGKFGKVAGGIAAGAAAALGAGAALSVREFAKFDEALNQSVAIMGDVSDAMRTDMSDAAREVAKSTTFSADQAAESFFFLASAGLDAEASIAAMPQVAKFAQAGMFDMATATDLATDAQSALGLTSADAQENLENLTRVTDVFVRANTLANTSVEQLATAFTTKAGTALKTVGKDVEEGAAALALFADQGVKGELAGTQLTNTIFGLTDRAQKAPEAFEKLGISVFDAEGNMKNFADIADDLGVAFEGMSEEQKLAELGALGFSKQARAGVLLMTGQGDKLREYETALRDAAGFTEEVAGKQLMTPTAQFALLGSSLKDVGLELGSVLTPALGNMAGALAPIVNNFLPVFSEFLNEKIRPGIETLTSRFMDFGAEVREGSFTMEDFFSGIMDSIKEFFTGDGLGKMLESFLEIRQKILDALIEIIPAVVDVLVEILPAIIETLADMIPQILAQAVETFNALVDAVVEVLPVLLEALLDMLPDILTTIIDMLPELVLAGIELFTGLVDAVVEVLPDILQAIINAIPQIVDAIIDALPKIIDAGFELFSGLIEGLIDATPDIIDAIIELIPQMVDALMENIPKLVNAGFELLKGLAKGIMDNVPRLIGDAVASIGSALIGGINNLLGIRSPSRVFMDIGQNVVAGLEKGLNEGERVLAAASVDMASTVQVAATGELATMNMSPVTPMTGPRQAPTGNAVFNISVNAGMGADGQDIGRKIVDEIIRYERASGRVFARA